MGATETDELWPRIATARLIGRIVVNRPRAVCYEPTTCDVRRDLMELRQRRGPARLADPAS